MAYSAIVYPFLSTVPWILIHIIVLSHPQKRSSNSTTMNIPGLVAVIVFYAAILAIGVFYGKKTSKAKSREAVLVADRSLGIFVSFFTITGETDLKTFH